MTRVIQSFLRGQRVSFHAFILRYACYCRKKVLTDINIREKILETIFNSEQKTVSADLVKSVAGQLGTDRRSVQRVLGTLVGSRDLMYTYKLGCSFIEPSILKPVRMSSRVVIMPWGVTCEGRPEDIVIQLEHGASFGVGDHPTTRLAIKGIERALVHWKGLKKTENRTMLDIGTGTGILALVSVRLGINRALGIDIDPCAIFEARKNVKINGLTKKIAIEDIPANEICTQFNLITANLRYPSLKKMFPHINRLIAPGGSLVISGIKSNEEQELVEIYTRKYFTLAGNVSESGWAGLVFNKIFKG